MKKKDLFASATACGCVYNAIADAANREAERFQKELQASCEKAEQEAKRQERRIRNAEEKTFICPACGCPFTITRGWFENKRWHMEGAAIEHLWKEHDCPHCGSVVKIASYKQVSSRFVEFMSFTTIIILVCALCIAAFCGLDKWLSSLDEYTDTVMQYIGFIRPYPDDYERVYGFYDEASKTLYWCELCGYEFISRDNTPPIWSHFDCSHSYDMCYAPEKSNSYEIAYYPNRKKVLLSAGENNDYFLRIKKAEADVSKDDVQSIMQDTFTNWDEKNGQKIKWK